MKSTDNDHIVNFHSEITHLSLKNYSQTPGSSGDDEIDCNGPNSLCCPQCAGLILLSLVLSYMIENYDAVLKGIAVDLSNSRAHYNEMLDCAGVLGGVVRRLQQKATRGGNEPDSSDSTVTDDEREKIARLATALNPETPITKGDLKTNDPLSLSQLRDLESSAQQRLVYMNSLTVQKGGLVQAAQANYQIVTQFFTGVISVYKTIQTTIAQRI